MPLLFRTAGNTGKVYLSQACYGSQILHKGGTMWKLHIWTDQGQYYIGCLWGRLNQPGVRLIHSRDGRWFYQGKTWAHHEGSHTVEEYTCRIIQRGITTHGHLAQHKGWPWAYRRVLDLASGASPHLTAEGAGGTSTGFAEGNWTEKQ